MATASPVAFSAMDPPVIDDTMEMASPYPGHADDFDIDLDVMDDQASNTDKDMIGDDEFEEPPQPTYEQDGANDADMIDDVAEPTMLDADDQYAETSYSVEMQYGTEKLYEADMLEDDFEEDIDAPVPEAPVPELREEAPTPLESAVNQVTSEQTPTGEGNIEQDNSGNQTAENLPETGAESAHVQDAPEEVTPHHHHQDTDHVTQEPEVGQSEREKVDNNVNDTNKPAQVDIPEVPGDYEDDTTGAEQPQVYQDDTSGTQPILDEHKEPEEEQREHTAFDDSHEQETKPAGDNEQENDTAKDIPLYPVRVYYQENEISLFPPHEGDSSETFFLEDENLAYAPLGELFQSCRGVLREHIGDNEVLIMDVDALNIQLTEDSSHISKITLYQIVDLYLQLCHNDGVDEPEPLYLTLNTKLTISAEVSDLLLAASEGKGLSEIHSWDGYHEVEGALADILEGDDQELKSDEEQQDMPYEKVRRLSEPQDVHGKEPTTNDHQVAEGQQDDQCLEGDDASANISDDAPEAKEASRLQLENPKPCDRQSPNEASYDSEEEQHTESTATITNLPANDSTDGQQHPDGFTDVPPNNQEAHDTHEERYELEGTSDKGFPEEGISSVTANSINYEEEDEGDASGHEHDHSTEPNTEKHHEEPPKESYEDTHTEVESVSQDDEDDTEETLQGDEGDTLPKVDSTVADVQGNLAQPSPDLADVSLGITEDLKSSIGGPENMDDDFVDTGLPGEITDVAQDTASNAIGDEVEELPFDDEEEYLDFGIDEDLGVADEEIGTKSVSASTKRHREPEDDEFELAESPTPDAKRSRSS
ncbi:hypothetical protein ETB97_010916 [Aspergillus alliaceus]|uniref:Uncharacterized protein n=1 Tax=Petromyces alliaceus TaxID=209559 RepID=A0A8H6AA60_PETAA|nr:hypothetical protein ETB97_010916 [Aspergillus burnettii]